jgi:hypothetical protein
VTASGAAAVTNGPATAMTGVATVVSDAIPPTFVTGPSLGLRTGTVNKTGTPVAVTWRAADNTLVGAGAATTPTAATFGPTTTSWNTTAGPGARTFTLTAADAAGNTRTASTTGTATLYPETAALRTVSWRTTQNSSDLDGTALTSTTAGAALIWTFTGRSVGWVATRTTTSGQAVVYLDGTKMATVDLKGAATAYRQAVWIRNGLTPGIHTLKIVTVGTANRPTVTTDGIISLS